MAQRSQRHCEFAGGGCPDFVPSLPPGALAADLGAGAKTYVVMRFYEAAFERLIRKNGEDRPPDKALGEWSLFDKAVAKRAH